MVPRALTVIECKPGGEVKRKDIQSVTTDTRGEFAFRVPAGAMSYTVRVEADGWETAEKSVQTQWDQRVDVTFRLKPASKKEAPK